VNGWRTTGVLFLSMSALIPACSRKPLIGEGSRAVEIEIIDPTTLSIDGDTVRLADVSAPRRAPHARCWAEALLAREAMEVLRAETGYTHDVDVIAAGADQAVARVLVHGRDLSKLLVDQGLAAPTAQGWDWCGPMTLNARGAPRLGYRVEAAHRTRPTPPAASQAAVDQERK